ncbi:TonB-dependent receptor family protein [Colwellia psychrerythraea]|uniref:TonB-dependent receptor n=1 Tax=Colwellia psychrerythraea TaxID=28229 RepID=A0A099KYL8_COLPS|nr:TonB-dependent receptor [Colwellia psychrerythraea]KGJ94952.1 TonB-dependent receptor [Colwellia psychrerythraea]
MKNFVVTKSPVAQALTLALILTFGSQQAFAADEASPSNGESSSVMAPASSSVSKQVEVISIFGSHNQLETATGSAVVIGEAQLDLFEFDDIHRVLQSVPGVYVREEDGYGLRPNIGLRGATSERSSKIALMEDGVLIAPAPYAAPAAYYFPMMSRMTQVEIFKGPSAIQYGPNTVGGAINMVSRPITDKSAEQGGEGMLDLAYGQDNYQKAHGYYSQNIASDNAITGKGQVGVLVEAIHLGSDGFKSLTGVQGNEFDTGFEKNEVLMKLNYVPSNSESNQFFQLKMAYGEETSNETYLGLTDDDFAIDSDVRYLASQKDQMDWEHYQFQLSHYIELSDEVSLFSQAYHREFDRDWDRFNSFVSNRSVQRILTEPEHNQHLVGVLRGESDTLGKQDSLVFTLNDRRYYSKGIETKLTWDTNISSAEVIVDTGIRLHQDNVTRKHTASYYDMTAGIMELNGTPSEVITQNDDTATAVAAFTNVNAVIDKFHITLGLRIEHIEGEAKDLLENTIKENSDTVFLPGAGLFYQLTAEHGLLVGVNKGYVPNSPGQESNIDPEESWNYEFGWRYSTDDLQGEVIGFYNDYSNLKAKCTFSSSSDCTQTLDQEFNGGEVDVYGIEASTSINWQLTSSVTVPLKVAYTYSQSEFKTKFNSTFSQWGNVEVGDELPYLPEHQLSIEAGLQGDNWQTSILLKYLAEMSEAAGSNTELEGLMTDELLQVDFSAWYQVYDQLKLYGKIDNITDEKVIVSRRPFGARPGKPRQVIVGVKYSF